MWRQEVIFGQHQALIFETQLRTLARRVSDLFLPDIFYDSTFTIADGCPQRSPGEEEDLVMAFDHKLEDTLAEKCSVEEGSEHSDSDSEDYDIV